MTPLAAIQTATINAADLLGWTKQVGTLEPAKWADIIAVNGDPTKDVTTLKHVKFVTKGGVVYKTSAPRGKPKEAKDEVVCRYTESLHRFNPGCNWRVRSRGKKDLSHA